MNRTTTLLAILVISLFFVVCNKMEEKKPNVILIIVDDQGYGDAVHSSYFVEDKYSAPYENILHAPFYGMISNIDENIGKRVDYLKSIKLIDNTILIFTTDNGTTQGAKVEGHRLDGFVVKGNNAGMRGIKARMYEGGHRVPLFIHWKDGGISKGKFFT